MAKSNWNMINGSTFIGLENFVATINNWWGGKNVNKAKTLYMLQFVLLNR